MIHPGVLMAGQAVGRIAGEGERFARNAGAGGGGSMISQCTCPYCNRSFGFSEDGKPVIEPPEEPRAEVAEVTLEQISGGKYSCYCSKCEYSWESQIRSPKRCPNCGSYHWEKGVVNLECQRCGHTWGCRKSTLPLRCPKCRSVYWNKPRPVPKKAQRIVAHSAKGQYDDRTEEAVRRCIEGESLVDVCVEMDVAVLEVAMIIKGRGESFSV